MTEKIGHIKNPLTIIAVFAGLAEVGGTIVLPFLQAPVQATYVWFLMGFPTLLVAVFFYVLYHKHEVLYSPSDFQNDDTFKGLIQARVSEKTIHFSEPLKSSQPPPPETPPDDQPPVKQHVGPAFDSLSPTTRKILKTLWKHQREQFPGNNARWGFTVGSGAVDFFHFALGLAEGMNLNLVALENRFCYLTDWGYAYCEQNTAAIDAETNIYTEFTNSLPKA